MQKLKVGDVVQIVGDWETSGGFFTGSLGTVRGNWSDGVEVLFEGIGRSPRCVLFPYCSVKLVEGLDKCPPLPNSDFLLQMEAAEGSKNNAKLHPYVEGGEKASESPYEPVESDGGSSKYYSFTIRNKQGESMQVEVGDVIRDMVGNDFDFGNCIKALRRMWLAKQGGGKAGTDVEYDANKINYFVEQIKHF